MRKVEDLKIKIFADGADKTSIIELDALPFIKGFTTNPTLMCKAGIADYEKFAKDILLSLSKKPISFEVFSDEFLEMERQARTIASWGNNVYVKIPITNTRGESSFDLIKKLSASGIKINVTAVLSLDQVRHIVNAFALGVPGIVSLFAGRVADTGRDPVPMMAEAKQILSSFPDLELLWASPRELLNIFQAEEVGVHIITVTPDILKKLEKVGYSLEDLSLDTVKMFFNDGKKAGYILRDVNMYYDFINNYLDEVRQIAEKLDRNSINSAIEILYELEKSGGRLFIIGIGGSAANASHAVNDFRKICGIEAYAPTDNVAELTAWTNDNSFEVIFSNWLHGSRMKISDVLMVFSVGGGSEKVSRNIVMGLEYAKSVGAKIIGIVSRDGGVTKRMANVTVMVPIISEKRITPHAESWQVAIWHLIVNALADYHPRNIYSAPK